MNQINVQQFNQSVQTIKDEQRKLNSSFSKSVDLLLVELLKKLIKVL